MYLVNNGPEGSGRRAFAGTPYKAGGKSGTAQVVGMKENQRYDAKKLKVEHRDNALFVTFAPYDNPTVVCAIILENAGGGGKMQRPLPAPCWTHTCSANMTMASKMMRRRHIERRK